MKEPTVILNDPSLNEHYRRETYVATTTNDGFTNVEDGFVKEVLPEGIMAKLEEFTGNGEGRVTVSGDLAVSDYGNKGGAFFSVSVNCDSSMEAIQGVHDLLAPWVQNIVAADCESMKTKRDILLGNFKPTPAPVSKGPVVPTKLPPKAVSNKPPAVRR
jgi:hypothetical protein